MPPIGENSTALESHVLVCYLPQLKIEHLTMSHQVSKCLELPIMNEVLSDSTSQNVD